MADALNIYFSSVFTLEDKNSIPVHEHNTVLLKTSMEKDTGVTISADWKVSE